MPHAASSVEGVNEYIAPLRNDRRAVDHLPVVLLLARGAARQRAGRELLERAGLLVVMSSSTEIDVAREAHELHPAVIVADAASYADGALGVLRALSLAGVGCSVALLAPPPPARHDLTVAALRLGADDVLFPTASEQELAARLDSLQRRSRRDVASPARVVHFGDMELDLTARTLRRGTDWIDLAPRVLGLLVALARRAPLAVSRAELLRDVWEYDPGAETRTVDTHVSILRRAVEPDPARPRYVRTVLKVGYRFTP